jgi:hypothetical protein
MASWYSEHPVVSTVLWLMGSSATSLEGEDDDQGKPKRCLSWKDEHDGGPIAEYMSTPKSPQPTVKFSNGEEKEHMPRMRSLAALPRSDSSSEVCSLINLFLLMIDDIS